MKKIEMTIECPDCRGTGLYSGMGEGQGAAVICHKCKGTGAYFYSYSYKEFTERKKQKGIKRVYLAGGGYKIGLGKINFTSIGEIDMDKEGISYSEFLAGKKPSHIKKLGCPMLLDQDACHNKEGFVKECNILNGGWFSQITTCKKYQNKEKCWLRFEL